VIERITRQCKCCAQSFEQPRLNLRPLEFCSERCRYKVRRESKARQCRERYERLCQAGVGPLAARRASHGNRICEQTLAAARAAKEMTG
jgi:hypothetical protein